jgi:hypothetical protein
MPGSRQALAAKIAEWAALALIPLLTAIRAQFLAPASPTQLSEFLLKALHEWYAFTTGCISIIRLAGKGYRSFSGLRRRVE